jgi:hypothetical protein
MFSFLKLHYKKNDKRYSLMISIIIHNYSQKKLRGGILKKKGNEKMEHQFKICYFIKIIENKS